MMLIAPSENLTYFRIEVLSLLEDTLKRLFIKRAKVLGRVSKSAILRSELTDDRKEQLERIRQRYEARKREREKKRERGEALGIDLYD